MNQDPLARNKLEFRVLCEGDADGVPQTIHEQSTNTNSRFHAAVLTLTSLHNSTEIEFTGSRDKQSLTGAFASRQKKY